MSEEPTLDIDYVAQLARISLTEEEKARYAKQLSKVLGYFQELAAVDTEGVEPTAHANPIFDVMREDVAVDGLPQERALMNAPKQLDGEVVVPKVIE